MAIKEINTELEKVTNYGMCIFGSCEGKATGWIYNIYSALMACKNM